MYIRNLWDKAPSSLVFLWLVFSFHWFLLKHHSLTKTFFKTLSQVDSSCLNTHTAAWHILAIFTLFHFTLYSFSIYEVTRSLVHKSMHRWGPAHPNGSPSGWTGKGRGSGLTGPSLSLGRLSGAGQARGRGRGQLAGPAPDQGWGGQSGPRTARVGVGGRSVPGSGWLAAAVHVIATSCSGRSGHYAVLVAELLHM